MSGASRPGAARYAFDELVEFAGDLLVGAGLGSAQAHAVAEVLAEADLLGHDTHGLQLLASYLAELEKGAMTKDARRLQWLLRLAPFNPATISYLSGASGVRFGSFLLACSALTPHVALEVWGGHAARHFIDASRSSTGTHYLHDALLIGGFVAALVVLHQVSRTARQAIADAVHEPGAAEHKSSYDAHNPAPARSTRS